ncbi:MAG: hypothetical protein HY360_09545 [Verrucomicrobia bacterium]|nr:hypothetical protein [Verrucomicrobiota bacterium]
MKEKLSLCIVAAGLAPIGFLFAGGIQVSEFTTDKALYDLHTPVVFSIKLDAAEDTAAVLALAVQRGADRPMEIVRENVELKKGPFTKAATWNAGLSEYGHKASLTIRSSDGTTLTSADTLFEVCRDWPKIARWAPAEACKDCAPDDIREKIGGRRLSVEQVMANMRSRHLNTYELFAFPPHSYELDVQEEEWPPYNTNQAKRGLRVSAGQTLRIGRLLKKQGFKLILYNETSSYFTDDERHRLYGPNDGKPVMPYPMERGEIDPNAFEIADLFGRQLAGSIKRFGWDGVFMDSCSQSMYATYWSKDKNGNRLTDQLPGEVGRYYVTTARERVAPVNPRFKFVSQNFNASVIGRHYHSTLPLEEIEPAIRRYYYELKWDRFVDVIDLLSIEYQMHEVNKEEKALFANRLDKMVVAFNTLKSLTRKPQLAFFHINHPDQGDGAGRKAYRTVAAAKPILAAIFAARTSLCDYGSNYGGHLTGPADDPVNAAFIAYHRFIMRYSQYLYDLELDWVRDAEKEFRVEATTPLFWKYTVYRRVFADREEFIVNLLQFPEDGLIYAVRPKELPPVANVELSWPNALALPFDPQNQMYLKPAKENRTEVFAMSPDDANQDPVELKLRKEGDRLTASVPKVGAWTMVVIRKFYPEYDRNKFIKTEKQPK